MDQDSLLRKILAGELHYAKLWVVCVALRGVAWDKMPFEQRELAFQAKDAASNCLAIFLNSSAFSMIALRFPTITLSPTELTSSGISGAFITSENGGGGVPFSGLSSGVGMLGISDAGGIVIGVS